MRYEKHFWLWFSYTLFFFLINRLGNPELHLATVLVSVPGFMFIFYSVWWSLNRFFLHRKYVSAVLSTVIVYGTVFVILFAVSQPEFGLSLLYGKYLVEGKSFQWRQFLQTYFIIIGHFSFIAVLAHQFQRYRIVTEKNLQEMRARLQEEQLRKEFQYSALSLPIPSHLLVNVFQSWASQLDDHHRDMKKQIQEMYELIRYFMIACLPDSPRTISLAQEIEVCQQYQRLHEELFVGELYIDWNIEGNTDGVVIPPTSLLTLLMNVFKHGDASCEGNPVCIDVLVEKDHYTVRMVNPLPKHKARQASHGLGLNNLRQRLDFVFQEKVQLVFEKLDHSFVVELQVKSF